MNIAVMAPHVHGNGVTSSAALIASGLSQRNVKVCLTHVKGKSEALFPYYSINSTAQHSSPTQIVNLIKMGGMNQKSVPNYCRSVSDRYDLFSLDADESDDITDGDVADVVKYMAINAPYDYIVFDVDENSFEKPAVKELLLHTDCVILVLSQKTIEMNLFKSMQKLITAKLRKFPVMVVVNKFRDSLGTIKELAASIGIENTKHWYTLHSNEWILYCENKGNLKYLSEQMHEKNGEVIDIEYDIQHIIQGIIAAKSALRVASNLERQMREEKEAEKKAKLEAKGMKKAPVKPAEQEKPVEKHEESDKSLLTETIKNYLVEGEDIGTDPKPEKEPEADGPGYKGLKMKHLGSESEADMTAASGDK